MQRITKFAEKLVPLFKYVELSLNSNDSTLKVKNNNGGFFSCCSERLYFIVAYVNRRRKWPLYVDSSNQMQIYKKPGDTDVFSIFFLKEGHCDIVAPVRPVRSGLRDFQYEPFNTINYTLTSSILKTYFRPTQEILDIKERIQEKYDIDPDNTLVAFYRGNDKAREMKLSSKNEFVEYVTNLNTSMRVWAQSDETSFMTLFPGALIMDSTDIRHCETANTSVDKVSFQISTQEYAKKFLAIVLLMSECATIVCNSGNCGMWICLFRGSSRGVHQRHSSGWIFDD